MEIVIIGAGGHAQVVADSLLLATSQQRSQNQVIGFLDDDISLHGTYLFNLPVLGSVEDLLQISYDALAIGIGSNKIRFNLFNKFVMAGEQIPTIIHPSAIIAPDVMIGDGTVICAGVIINTGTTIGNNVILNTGCTIDHHNTIADHVHIAPGVHTGGDVVIGEGTLVGIGATIMPQRHIGEWCTIGASSLVYANLQNCQTVIGVPAKDINS